LSAIGNINAQSLPYSHKKQGTKNLRFITTRAQKNRSRVKAARTKRLDDIRKLFEQVQMDYPPDQVLMRIFKDEDVLELWARQKGQKEFVHLKDYSICMRSGRLGPKRRQGDLQVPEGFYSITSYNPHSSYHLAMLVDYPNRSDIIRKTGKKPGGSICIHGDCVTIGCIPLTDRWIEELYLICLDTSTYSHHPTLVHIFPGRMEEQHWKELKRLYSQEPEVIEFWQELKKGYDLFEQTNIPAAYSIGRKGQYIFVEKTKNQAGP